MLSSERFAFTDAFQTKVLALMYSDDAFLRDVAKIIEPDFFTNKILSTYYEMFRAFVTKYPESKVSKAYIMEKIKLRSSMKSIKEEELPFYAKMLSEILVFPGDHEFIRERVGEFVASGVYELALAKAFELWKERDFDKIVGCFEGVSDTVIDEPADTEFVSSLENFTERLKAPEDLGGKHGIPTGIRGLDSLLFHAGLKRKEMGVVCGTPGRGKSVALSNFALSAVLRNHNVLYYTLEVDKDIVFQRNHACVTGIPIVDLPRNGILIKERWHSIQSAHRIGELYLHDLPAYSLTPDDIRRHLRWYRKKGVDIALVVVDYADIMRSDRNIDERRLEQGDIYLHLRAIAKEFKVAVWTASQGNREAMKKIDVDISSLAEDFSKAMTADYVIGLSQTKTESKDRLPDGGGTGTIRLFVSKNRNGMRGVDVPVLTDFVRARLSHWDWSEFDRRVYGLEREAA
jgi:replicative DNA helicase